MIRAFNQKRETSLFGLSPLALDPVPHPHLDLWIWELICHSDFVIFAFA
jgi:hypothetical protein